MTTTSTTRTRRPWHVFVRSVGPTYTFATEERAHERARRLVPEYAEVLVYAVGLDAPLERTVYRPDRPPVRERFGPAGWAPA